MKEKMLTKLERDRAVGKVTVCSIKNFKMLVIAVINVT